MLRSPRRSGCCRQASQLMLALGFRTAEQGWVWKGKHASERPRARKKQEKPRPGNAFSALAGLRL